MPKRDDNSDSIVSPDERAEHDRQADAASDKDERDRRKGLRKRRKGLGYMDPAFYDDDVEVFGEPDAEQVATLEERDEQTWEVAAFITEMIGGEPRKVATDWENPVIDESELADRVAIAKERDEQTQERWKFSTERRNLAAGLGLEESDDWLADEQAAMLGAPDFFEKMAKQAQDKGDAEADAHFTEAQRLEEEAKRDGERAVEVDASAERVWTQSDPDRSLDDEIETNALIAQTPSTVKRRAWLNRRKAAGDDQ